MKPTLTPKRMNVLVVVCALRKKNGFPPTIAEVAAKCKLSRATAHEHIRRLVKDGYLREARDAIRKYIMKTCRCCLLITLALLLSGCSRTTATYKDGVATVTRTRILMTEDIDSFSYDASDGSFTFEGYKSDMTKALILIDKLTAKDKENKP